jgi:hypothetical protein
MRPNPAGPLDPLEGPQLQRRLAFDYAVAPHAGTWRGADLYGLADAFLVPLERARAAGGRGEGGDGGDGGRPSTGRARVVGGAEVSAVRREPGGLVVRVFNPANGTAVTRVERSGAPARGWRVDLRGRPVERFEGEVPLRGCEIATLRIDEDGS